MTETTVGREPVQIVELRQPLCANTYGVAPCTASGAATSKCFNTRATCQDPNNFALGTALSLYFSSGRVAERGVSGATYIIPSLQSVSTAPTEINFTGGSPDAQGLGTRAVCSITLADHPHTDQVVDPYLSGRTYDPMADDRGSFWSRWMVRNKHRQNVVLVVYEGYAGQALSSMKKRTFFLQDITFDRSAGRVTITGKDVLSRIEERKAQAPIATGGLLRKAISNSDTTAEIIGATAADYPITGAVRIDDELMLLTAATDKSWGVELEFSARGALNTTAASHSADDAVQWCLRYVDEDLPAILTDLLQVWGGIPASYLDTAGWATENTDWLSAYLLSAVITDPTSVTELVSELMEQVPFLLWWDERDALVRLKAIRGIDTTVPTITAETHILAGSFSIEEKPRERASQVWVYYGRRNYLKAVTDPTSYGYRFISANLSSEGDEEYGEASIRKIFARWIPSQALAANTASKIATRFNEVPSECMFRMDAKDRDYWVGDTVVISHHMDVDDFGARRLRNWTIISAEEVVPGEVVEYRAVDTTLYGRVSYIMAAGSGNYPGAGALPAKYGYIGDASGLLSDGSDCARIS